MERHLTPEDARGAPSFQADSTPRLARALGQAARHADVTLARQLIRQALGDGALAGHLYVNVVRLVLDEIEPDAQATASLGEALIAELRSALPLSVGGGAGRTALLSCGESTIERLDGDVAAAFLEADGWAVHRFRGPEAALSLSAASRADGVELAVAVIAGPEQALRLASACSDMQRLPDPPVCLLCDFTGRSDWPSASTALGADALVSDPQELLGQAARRLPAGETRRWGVSITRQDGALVLVPTGMLDGTSAGRLADVVRSRIGTFASLIIDLRELAEISAAGVEGIRGWSQAGPLQDVEPLLVGDSGVRTRIAALGLSVPLADAV